MKHHLESDKRLSSILTSWTGNTVSSWTGLESHSFKSWMIAWRSCLGTSDFWSFSEPTIPLPPHFLSFVSTSHIFLYIWPYSGNFPPMLLITLHCNLPYTYPSYCACICVHFLFTMPFNPEDGGSIVLQKFGIQPPHYMVWSRKFKLPSSLCSKVWGTGAECMTKIQAFLFIGHMQMHGEFWVNTSYIHFMCWNLMFCNQVIYCKTEISVTDYIL